MENGLCFINTFHLVRPWIKKSWVHTESTDLVHFEETGTVMYPDTPLDSHGAYSGSAMEFGDKLFLFYTGNVRDKIGFAIHTKSVP